MDAIFNIERETNGLSAEKRLTVRRERVAPLEKDLEGAGDASSNGKQTYPVKHYRASN